MTELWTAAFPPLADLDAASRHELLLAGRRVRLPAGSRPFRAGAACESYLFVLDGRVRVQMVAESGREIVLYRVGAGETCVLTTACLMSGNAYPADALAETEVDGVVLPSATFHDLLGRSAGFRRFVFDAFALRIARLMAVIDEVVFRRLDVRLAGLLVARCDACGHLAATHQDLAVELGSAREVVSRLLKEFERRGWVELARTSIRVTAPAALRGLVAAEGR